MNRRHVAVLIPCLNEEKSVGKVISDFKLELPAADIYVFDNGSTDDTALIAKQEGAIVVQESRRGKGYVVQSMFRRVDSDIYVLIDGDDTYPADAIGQLLEPVLVLRETTERPEATEAGTARAGGDGQASHQGRNPGAPRRRGEIQSDGQSCEPLW